MLAGLKAAHSLSPSFTGGELLPLKQAPRKKQSLQGCASSHDTIAKQRSHSLICCQCQLTVSLGHMGTETGTLFVLLAREEEEENITHSFP